MNEKICYFPLSKDSYFYTKLFYYWYLRLLDNMNKNEYEELLIK